MYDYINGILAELNPNYAVIDCNGVGWLINISLYTYSGLEGKQNAKLYVQPIIREDAHTLYGFIDKNEREIFKLLCSVSGIGPNTARIILSSMNPSELQTAILSEDVNSVKRIKGIGAKTAQRLIIDLKDKIDKIGTATIITSNNSSTNLQNPNREEALAALVMLGYPKNTAEKALDAAIKQNLAMSTEDLIKYALKHS